MTIISVDTFKANQLDSFTKVSIIDDDINYNKKI